jgi:hypothetical protein
MMLVSLDNEVRADTGNEARAGKPFAFPALITQAAAAGKASSIVVMDHRLYQLVVVPVLAPVPIAWVGLAFQVDDVLAKELKEQTALEVSFLSVNGPAVGAAMPRRSTRSSAKRCAARFRRPRAWGPGFARSRSAARNTRRASRRSIPGRARSPSRRCSGRSRTASRPSSA